MSIKVFTNQVLLIMEFISCMQFMLDEAYVLINLLNAVSMSFVDLPSLITAIHFKPFDPSRRVTSI